MNASSFVDINMKMKQQITQLSSIIDCIRTEVNKNLPIQHLALLLAVADQPGVSMQGLMKQLRMPQGALCRNIKILADQYGLMYSQKIQGTKQSAVYPTAKGIELVEKLCALMQGKNLCIECNASEGGI